MKKQHAATTRVANINNIDLLMIENGSKLVPIKPICEILGVAPNKQIEKIKEDPILSSVGTLRVSTGSDGKQYEMFCIPLKFVFGWLFTINPDRVAPEAREAVIKYKLACYDALYNHFTQYYEYVEYRQKMVEEKLEVVETINFEFRNAKSRLDEAKKELWSARKLTLGDYLQSRINFEEGIKAGNGEKTLSA